MTAADGVVTQRPGRDDRQRDHQRLTGPGGPWCAGPRGQDRTDIGGPPPAERDGSFQRGDQHLGAMGCLQRGELVELGAELGDSGGGRALQERFRDRAQRAERLLAGGSGPDAAQWFVGSGAAVMVIDDRRLTRRHEGMVGDDLISVENLDPAVRAITSTVRPIRRTGTE